MTKVTIIGEEPKEKQLKPIEFLMMLCGDKEWTIRNNQDKYHNIVLLRKNYGTTGLDLMFAYNDMCSNVGVLYLGHFNDGIV